MDELSIDTVSIGGGRLCLDFANTVEWRERVRPVELLDEPDALARWARRIGLVDDAGLASIRAAQSAAPEPARAELLRSRRLREAIQQVLAAIADQREPPAAGLALIARTHAAGLRAGRLEPDDGAWRPAWAAADPSATRFAVAADAADLLADADALARVRRCPGEGCGWLFLDRTRARTRRWCSMEGCGSRDKMRRYYRRRRERAR